MRTLHSLCWTLFNLLLGLVGGITLGWGPLAASTPVIVTLGLTGALLGGSIGWWTPAKAQRRWVLAGHGVIFLAVALAAVIPLYRIGMLPLPGETRSANFKRLWHALDYAYPYFAEKGVDWDAIYAQYAPQAHQAQSDEAYWRVVAHMLAELNDGHTGLLSPSAQSGRRYFATCRDIGGAIVVDEVGAPGRAAGLERGDVVLAVDGRPIKDALDALSPVLVAGSTPQRHRAKAAFNVLSTTGDTLVVTVNGPAGERTLTLVWPKAPPAPQAKEPAPWQPLITGERLPSGLGLIRIPDFGGGSDHDLVAEFDAALDALMDAPGIILDLRGNGGGSTFISDPIAGRFLSQPFTYGRDKFRVRLPQRGWRAHFDYRVKPRGPTYTGPLVLLIDTYNFSTAENFIVALVDSGRATAVGRPTGGGSGNPVRFALPGGGQARFSTGAFRRNNGALIEGVGITPDSYVTWTVEDLRAGRDPDLVAADCVLLLSSLWKLEPVQCCLDALPHLSQRLRHGPVRVRGHRHSLHHGFCHDRVVRDAAHQLGATFVAERGNLAGPPGIQVGLVDHHQRGHAKMIGRRHGPLQIVHARDGRFDDLQGQVCPRTGRDHRAADARRPVDHQQVCRVVQRRQAGLLPDLVHQLARVFAPGKQVGVEQGAIARVRAEPPSGLLLLHADGLCRALVKAGSTPLAGDIVHLVDLSWRDGFKATDLGAATACRALLWVDGCHLPAPKVVRLALDRIEHQLQVGCVHIGVGQHQRQVL